MLKSQEKPFATFLRNVEPFPERQITMLAARILRHLWYRRTATWKPQTTLTILLITVLLSTPAPGTDDARLQSEVGWSTPILPCSDGCNQY